MAVRNYEIDANNANLTVW